MQETKGSEDKGNQQEVRLDVEKGKQAEKDNKIEQKKAEQADKKSLKEKPQSVVAQSNQKQSLQKPIQQQKSPQTTNQLSAQQKLALKSQLQSMQFEPYLIQQAIQNTSNLDQAIEFIINKLEFNQKQQSTLGLSKQVKIFFIVRMDLKMGTGKIAAQVGHAALRAFQNMRYSSSNNDNSASLLIEWMENGQKNKILQAETQNDLQYYLNLAGNQFINNCYIRDAGRTQIAAGSMTVAAIGPVRQCDAGFLKNLKEL